MLTLFKVYTAYTTNKTPHQERDGERERELTVTIEWGKKQAQNV